MRLPDWLRPAPSKETALQWAAAIASFGGSIIFTVGAGVMVWIIWKGGWTPHTEDKRLDLLGWAMIMTLAGSLSANWAFGFVLSKRTLKITKDGVEVSGGGSDAPTVTTTTTVAPTPPQEPGYAPPQN